MNKMLWLLVGLMTINSIYDFSMKDVDGNSFSLSQFRGKKILFVNTALSSGYASQLAGLESLYQKYKDSLIIITIPSNTFGNEPNSNSQIKTVLLDTYNAHFIITQKADIASIGESPLYGWLQNESENGMMGNTVSGDFFKFLVNSEGKLVGVFAPSVDPMDDQVQSAITN